MKSEELDEVEEGHEICSRWNLPRWDFERAGSDADLVCEELASDEEDFWFGP